jgi:hypothetical protein
MAPQTVQQSTIMGKSGFGSRKLNESALMPKFGDKDALVKSEY